MTIVFFDSVSTYSYVLVHVSWDFMCFLIYLMPHPCFYPDCRVRHNQGCVLCCHAVIMGFQIRVDLVRHDMIDLL